MIVVGSSDSVTTSVIWVVVVSTQIVPWMYDSRQGISDVEDEDVVGGGGGDGGRGLKEAV